MPANMKVGQTVTASPVETDATGLSAAILDPTEIQWTSSDPSIVSVSADDNSGAVVLTAVAAGVVTINCSDPGAKLAADPETVTVEKVIPPATKLAIEFGEPQ